MSSEQEQIKICDYLIRKLENQLTPQEEKELRGYLQNSEEAVELYVSIASLYAQFSIPNKLNLECEKSEPEVLLAYMDLLKELGDDEKQAETIIPLTKEPDRELIENVLYPPKEKRPISKLSLFSLIVSSAAVILVVLFVRFVPPKSDFEVATLTDSFNAKWADITTSMENGTRMVTGNEKLLLREGYAELMFDTNARVVIEAPAEFQILAEDRIGLNYGKIYSWVPKEAIGFSVYTHNAKIIDMGTEFGIDVDSGGSTQLHVLQGKTILIAGDKPNKVSVEVSKGVAKKVTADNHAISDISCNDRLFVREIDSAHKFVWRGETTINLADIVGGGNGFNSGKLNTGIDVATGKMIPDLPTEVVQVGFAGYKTVDSNPFIDGVFVPGLESSMTPITTDGSISVEFPGTSGNYWGYICNGAFHEGENVPRHALRLNGMPFGTRENPSITIHSNQGITFDLSKIRQNVPMGKMTKFRSLIGISETVKNHVDEAAVLDAETLAKATFSKADFWVFLDGRKVYELKVANSDDPVQVEIPVSAQDHYLTLAVTEADDSWAFDWALFGRPELVIEPTK